jgi:hypothetical protein
MSKSPYISCQKCAPFGYGEENEMTKYKLKAQNTQEKKLRRK